MSQVPRLGFSILSHRPPGTVFIQLLKRLREFPDAVIALHHDYSQSDFPQHIINDYQLLVVNPSRNTQWGHISKVPATLNTFQLLHQHQVDWLITVSPNCYLIKPAAHILQFLAQAEHDAFMNLDEIKPDAWLVPQSHYYTLFTRPFLRLPFMSRRGKFYIKTLRRPLEAAKSPFNDAFKPYCGSDWFMLNSRCLDYIISQDVYNHPLLAFLAEANSYPDRNASPIEIVVQTVLANNPSLNINTDYHRYIDWTNAKDWHPNILTIKDFEAIAASKALFARKLNDAESLPLIEKIDRELLKLSSDSSPAQ